MIRFRAFRNGDPPALASLWNRCLPGRAVVRPLNPHEFDALVIGRIDFDAPGLIVAEEDGAVVGFAHAGFGPAAPVGPGHGLDRELGTVAMLVVEPGRVDVGLGLIVEAEAYLRARGAKVFYAGGQHPLDPFYRGIYGGSESPGILETHGDFRTVAVESGYRPASTVVLLDADITGLEARDPRAALLRRQARVEVVEEARPIGWWEALALGHSQISRFRLVAKADDAELARASAWDMAAFGRLDGKARTGLYDVEVAPAHRRKGYGRHLVTEILRQVKGQWGEVVSVQTPATNLAALGLYLSIGFEPVGAAILYRKPGP